MWKVKCGRGGPTGEANSGFQTLQWIAVNQSGSACRWSQRLRWSPVVGTTHSYSALMGKWSAMVRAALVSLVVPLLARTFYPLELWTLGKQRVAWHAERLQWQRAIFSRL